MKKYYFLAALAATALAGCTNDDFVGDVGVDPTQPQDAPIVFNSLKGNFTRADITGSDAADLLNKKFVVTGYKGTQTAWDASDNKIVFDNYAVEYTANTANTTASNSDNWEYVGKNPIAPATANGITSQTIKYWDYSTSQYDFIAWSAGKKTAIFTEPGTGIPAGSVLVSAIDPTAAKTAAITFKGSAADLTDCYIADLVTVKKADYNKPVTLKFRALGSKVRIGIYETIPGYSVKNVKFYSAAATALEDETNGTDEVKAAAKATNDTPKLFTTSENDIYTAGEYTVYFPNVDDVSNTDNNQAHVKFTGTGTKSTVVNFGNLSNKAKEDGEKSDESIYLGRSSNNVSYAGEAEGNFYTQYMPNETATNLNLRVNYTLEATDGSGETIEVKGATAQVPSIYTQWKAGYAYTYLFKISDKTNGYTGAYDPTQPDDITVNSDPAGLYPITFDAVVVNDETDATQETITTVSSPSITSYQKGSTVLNSNEYVASTGDIFVTVNDGVASATDPALANGALQTLEYTDGASTVTKGHLYKIDAGKTEADVIDALQMRADNNAFIEGRNGMVLTTATLTFTNKIEYGVDGNTITVGSNQAAKFTPEANTTYAFVYTKKQPETFSYVKKTFSVGTSVSGYSRYDYVDAPTGDVKEGVLYFTDATSGKKAVFLGQTVTNVFTRSGDAESYIYTAATGYAATGTEYYYKKTDDDSYYLAANIAYADFATATDLYTYANNVYTLKTDAEPVSGTAYYKKVGDVYTYCIILPEQANGLKVIGTTVVDCGATEKAVDGQTYFYRYQKNDGVYYAKVIKVQ